MRIGSVISSRASLAASRSAGSSSQASPVSVENSTSGPTAVRRPCFCLPLLRPHRHIRLPQRPVVARAGPRLSTGRTSGPSASSWRATSARRARIGFGRGPPLDCGGQLRRAGLEVGGFGFQGLARGLAPRSALAVPATSIAATNTVDRGRASAVHDRKGARPQTGPHH